jgi:hypothetical protein
MFFWESCHLWDNVEKYGTARRDTDGNIIWRMRFWCRITKAINTYSECVILIAFPLQQWLRERASVLCYTYSACLFQSVFMSASLVNSCLLLSCLAQFVRLMWFLYFFTTTTTTTTTTTWQRNFGVGLVLISRFGTYLFSTSFVENDGMVFLHGWLSVYRNFIFTDLMNRLGFCNFLGHLIVLSCYEMNVSEHTASFYCLLEDS